MDVETSLSWRGPYWYAGRNPRPDSDKDGSEFFDVELTTFYRENRLVPKTLPAAIVVDTEALTQSELEPFFEWLSTNIGELACEVPFYILTGSNDSLPKAHQATAITDRIVPDDILLMLICIHQRALLRSDEALLRRRVLGRVPGFGAAPHQSGSSSLLVVGLSGRFLELQDASDHKVEVVGAFDGKMAVEFLSKRAFDAIVIDAAYEDTVEYMQQIRRDSRFAGLPMLAVCESEEDLAYLFRNGANDVLMGEGLKETLVQRLNVAIRFGKRRRLADRVLAESRMWLRQQVGSGGLGVVEYTSYLETCSNALAARGLDLWEIKLQPEYFGIEVSSQEEKEEIHAALLSIADATSRDEDFVCLVKELGPVAVLKNEEGTARLQSRINSILAHTVLQ